MIQSPWAVNADKFHRAAAWAEEQKKNGVVKEVTDEMLKARYEAIGGLLTATKSEDSSDAQLTLEDMNVSQLKKRAAVGNIDIEGITTKAELIAAIREVEEAE